MARIEYPEGESTLLVEASRRDFLRMLALTGGAGAVAAFLSACGGSTSPTATASSGTVAAPTVAAPTAATTGNAAPAPAPTSAAAPSGSVTTGANPTQASGKLASSQVFRLWDTEPQHADPNAAASGNEVRIVMAMFDGLLTFDRDGKAIPLVAEKWEISPDGKMYTFHLRDGVKWTDGQPVTARDFEYSIKRLASPELASEYAQASYPITGAQDYNTGKNKDPNSVAVKAVDDKTLTIALDAPAAYFLPVLATWNFMPIPRATVEKNGAKWVEPGNSVSNGPFKLDSWKHDQELVLVRNETYWGPKPALEKLVFTITADPQKTTIPAYENNELDVSAQVPPSELDRIRSSPTLSKELMKFPASTTNMLFFDVSNAKSPVSKPEVRNALYLALDLNQIAMQGFKGLYDPAPTITPQGILGYNPNAALKGGVAKAKQLLASAGYPDGKGFPSISLVWGQTTDYDLLAQILQQSWKDQLNIDVQLQRMEVKAFRSFFTSLSDKTIHYDIYLWSWGSDYEDPYNWYNILWESDQDFFRTRWQNTQYDDLVRKSSSVLDTDMRRQMCEQAEVLLMNDMPVLPIYHTANSYLVKPWVQNLLWSRVATQKFLQNVSIAQH
jgi:oligopeptide transport system substrate-binding protein